MAIFLGAPGPLPYLHLPPAWGQYWLQTRCATVLFHAPEDLTAMDRRLSFKPAPPQILLRQGNANFLQTYLKDRLAAKIDGLLAAVSRLLYLEQPQQNRLTIRILRDGWEVRKHYRACHAKEGSLLGYRPLEAYYESSTQTVYLSLEDLRPGILAHEMTHYLFCTALPVPPAAPVQEEWAAYVESHLGY